MKKIFYTIAACAVVLATSCEKDNLAPMPEDGPEITAMNFPSTMIAGMTVRAGGTGVRLADTSNMYLRPLTGGEDVKVIYGDKYQPKNEWGVVHFDPFGVVFTVPEDIADGDYNFVVKRPSGDVVVKRTSTPQFNVNDDGVREPVTHDHFKIFHVSMAEPRKVYSAKQVVTVYGSEINLRDSLAVYEYNADIHALKKHFQAKTISCVPGKSITAVIPASCEEGVPYDLVIRRRGQGYPVDRFVFKAPLAIEDIEFPAAAVQSGKHVAISCTGAQSGDKVYLVTPDLKRVEAEGTSAGADGVSFTIPTSVKAGPVKVELFRNEDEAIFDMGYLSFNGAVEITGIPDSGYGSIPSMIPAGYPFKVNDVLDDENKPIEHKMTLHVNGNGFNPGDKIRFNGKEYDADVTSSFIEFSLATKEVSGKQKIELVRGETVKLLKEVTVVAAPKVGDFAEGGVVIWVDPIDPVHGLVCDVRDYTQDKANQLRFSLRAGVGSSDMDIKSSLKNTEAILKAFDNEAPAAKYCMDLVVKVGDKTYDDWALPSDQAVAKMLDTFKMIDRVSKANKGTEMIKAVSNPKVCYGYASSTQTSAFDVHAITLNGPGKLPAQGKAKITNLFYVRAVRNY